MLVTVARYSNMIEANLAKSKIEWAGIPAFLSDEYTITVQWLYSDAMGGIRLLVPEAFRQQALDILKEDWSVDLPAPEEDEKQTCPHCGSTETEFYLLGRRAAFTGWLFLNWVLWPLTPGIKCRSCGKTSKQPSQNRIDPPKSD